MRAALHPHFIKPLQATAAAGTVVQMGCHPVSVLDQPKLSGLGAAMSGFSPSVQILARYTVHTLVYML